MNWIDIIEEKREEISEALMEAKAKAEHPCVGWGVSVEIDKNDVWVTGLHSQGTQSESSFNGTSRVLYTFQTWQAENDEEREYQLDEVDVYEIIDNIIEKLEMYQ